MLGTSWRGCAGATARTGPFLRSDGVARAASACWPASHKQAPYPRFTPAMPTPTPTPISPLPGARDVALLLNLAVRTGRHVCHHISALLAALEGAGALPSEPSAQSELRREEEGEWGAGEELDDDAMGFERALQEELPVGWEGKGGVEGGLKAGGCGGRREGLAVGRKAEEGVKEGSRRVDGEGEGRKEAVWARVGRAGRLGRREAPGWGWAEGAPLGRGVGGAGVAEGTVALALKSLVGCLLQGACPFWGSESLDGIFGCACRSGQAGAPGKASTLDPVVLARSQTFFARPLPPLVAGGRPGTSSSRAGGRGAAAGGRRRPGAAVAAGAAAGAGGGGSSGGTGGSTGGTGSRPLGSATPPPAWRSRRGGRAGGGGAAAARPGAGRGGGGAAAGHPVGTPPGAELPPLAELHGQPSCTGPCSSTGGGGSRWQKCRRGAGPAGQPTGAFCRAMALHGLRKRAAGAGVCRHAREGESQGKCWGSSSSRVGP